MPGSGRVGLPPAANPFEIVAAGNRGTLLSAAGGGSAQTIRGVVSVHNNLEIVYRR
jgi:hypothetical protein